MIVLSHCKKLSQFGLFQSKNNVKALRSLVIQEFPCKVFIYVQNKSCRATVNTNCKLGLHVVQLPLVINVSRLLFQ